MTKRPTEVTAVAIVVVAYEAEAFIEGLLARIPDDVCGHRPWVLVADDASLDATAELAGNWSARQAKVDVEVVRRPRNLGYGGNQIASFNEVAARGHQIVVLLHGDEQYPPERIGRLVERLLVGDVAAVYGSRMIDPGGARAGGMPVDRYLGNRVLSRALNVLTGAHFTEWFSGFRAYRLDALAAIGIDDLPPGFDFDTAITARLHRSGHRIEEVAMPTRYADEISRVPLLRTGFAAIRNGVRYRRRWGPPPPPALAPIHHEATSSTPRG